jgi:hypothetical protein
MECQAWILLNLFCSYSKSSTEAKYMDDPNPGIIIGDLGLRV